MPNIHISDAQYQRLSALAHAAGYQDISAFISSCTDVPVQDPREGLAEDQLLANVAKIQRGEKEIDSGGGQNMKEAIVEIANKHGLNIGQ